MSACLICPAGQYSASDADGGTATCTKCSPGLYSVAAGSSYCDSADVGYYVPTAGATAEIACPIGKYSENSEQWWCDPCGLGYYG